MNGFPGSDGGRQGAPHIDPVPGRIVRVHPVADLGKTVPGLLFGQVGFDDPAFPVDDHGLDRIVLKEGEIKQFAGSELLLRRAALPVSLMEPEGHADRGLKNRDPGVLDHIAVRGDVFRFVDEMFFRVGREENDGNIAVLEDPTGRLGPVHSAAEIDVHQNEIDFFSPDPDGLDRLFSAMDDDDLVSFVLELLGLVPGDEGFVFDEEESLALEHDQAAGLSLPGRRKTSRVLLIMIEI